MFNSSPLDAGHGQVRVGRWRWGETALGCDLYPQEPVDLGLSHSLQETRALPEQLDTELREPDGYNVWFHPAENCWVSYRMAAAVEKRSPAVPGLNE